MIFVIKESSRIFDHTKSSVMKKNGDNMVSFQR